MSSSCETDHFVAKPSAPISNAAGTGIHQAMRRPRVGRRNSPKKLPAIALRLLAFAHAQGVSAAFFACELLRPGFPGWRKTVLVKVTVYFVNAELRFLVLNS